MRLWVNCGPMAALLGRWAAWAAAGRRGSCWAAAGPMGGRLEPQLSRLRRRGCVDASKSAQMVPVDRLLPISKRRRGGVDAVLHLKSEGGKKSQETPSSIISTDFCGRFDPVPGGHKVETSIHNCTFRPQKS